jgi:hypothetical protein
MKFNIKNVFFYGLLLAPLSGANATDLWTAEIAHVTAMVMVEQKVILKNLTEGPAGQSSTVCTSNSVWLAPNSTDSATPAALSLALAMYTVRIAFNGTSANCILIHMGNRN